MSGRLSLIAAGCLTLLLSIASPGFSQGNGNDPASLWDDFNHYVLIARPDLAEASGTVLLQTVDGSSLLDIVEASDFANYVQALDRARQIEQVQDVSQQLLARLLKAAVDRSRDPQRIAADISQLAEGRRPAEQALVRLRAAGQFAVPQMLEVFEESRMQQLTPYVTQALVAMGPQVIMPLSEAINHVQSPVAGRLAQILAEIGYPESLPALRLRLDSDDLDPDARERVRRAYDQLLLETGVPDNLTAAQLYLSLGLAQFQQGTIGAQPLGFDAVDNVGVIWMYDNGLAGVPVPAAIYPDVLAMRSAMRALRLNPSMDDALNLQLVANFRRTLRLAEGAMDPSYPTGMRSPAFYGMLAGPVHLQSVLATALQTQDTALALEAIDALGNTAGTNALVNIGAAQQPLMEALAYPDRRVRFHAAQVLAQARPREAFPGSFRVVAVLSEAIRQGDRQVALVITPTTADQNRIQAQLSDLGFDVITGASVLSVTNELQNLPGVDLVVVQSGPGDITRAVRESSNDYKLANAPVIGITSPGNQLELMPLAQQTPRLLLVDSSTDPQLLVGALAAVRERYEGAEIAAAEADAFAIGALESLVAIAEGIDVYQAQDALPALIDALRDQRDAVVVLSAHVLALLEDAQAQQAIAQRALTASGQLQIDLLDRLALSATRYGNLLEPGQTDRLLGLVDATSSEDLAVAVSRAHGALTLPAASAVRMLPDF